MGEIDRRYFDGLMADKKLSLRGLATRMGMNHSQLSLAFSGSRKLQLEEVAMLSQIFGEPIHRIIEAAGVDVRAEPGRRASVIGSVGGDGVVTLYTDGTVERTTIPDLLPEDVVALQFRTLGTSLDWIDGAVVFCRKPHGLDPSMNGRLSYCKIKDGPAVIATIRRGYRDGTYNLSGTTNQESVALEWASPIILTRH
jgi:transcriptional regulator with XRE-family HTH domain